MKTLIMLTCTVLLLAGTAWAQTGDVLISEYVEGSGNNKAIELFNGTTDDVDLGELTLERYSNGSTSAYAIALDDVMLAPGETWVLANTLADAALLALADQLDAAVNFNGDDALVLSRQGSVVDSIGQVGFDPGTSWSCGIGSTLNSTLRRLATICSGDTDPFDAFDPCDEYAFSPADTFDDLGQHVIDCTSVPIQDLAWGALKSTYR